MMYRWKEGSMCRSGKIILTAGDFIPEGLLDEDTLERHVKSGAIEAIKEPELAKNLKKASKKTVTVPETSAKAGPVKKDDDADIKDLM